MDRIERVDGADEGPLTGVRVGVTADRRADDQIALLQRRGARTVHGPTMRIVPVADDTDVAEATRALVATPPDVVVVTTGQGFGGWLEAADGFGLGDELRTVLGRATVLARGPKACGAIRGAGLREAWSAAETESSPEVLAHLLASGVDGVRVAVQLHGDPMSDFLDRLREAGADVATVRVYRWEPPPDLAGVDALIDAVVAAEVDTVTFTSAPAVDGLVHRAQARGCVEALLGALRGPVLACSVGPVTSAPLDRLGAMVKRLEEYVAGDGARRSSTRGAGDGAQRSSTRGAGDGAQRSSARAAGDLPEAGP